LLQIETTALTLSTEEFWPNCIPCPKIALLPVRMLSGMTRLLIAILATALCAGAAAGLQNPLRDRLLRHDRTQETIGWYQRADTGEFFLFDRSGPVAFLQPRNDETAEVLILFGNRAPGGGNSYVTDTGREVIRMTGLGGTTYFPSDAPDGVIAEYASPAGGLAPPPRSPEEVRIRAEDLVEDIARILNHDVTVEYTPAPRAGLGLQFDTFQIVEQAFRGAQSDRRALRDLAQVQITTGDQPAAYKLGNSLIVVIAPEFGYAGRPSSEFIVQVLLSETSQN